MFILKLNIIPSRSFSADRKFWLKSMGLAIARLARSQVLVQIHAVGDCWALSGPWSDQIHALIGPNWLPGPWADQIHASIGPLCLSSKMEPCPAQIPICIFHSRVHRKMQEVGDSPTFQENGRGQGLVDKMFQIEPPGARFCFL